MGTNYYLNPQKCVCGNCSCGSKPERLHIGKSSIGWCFALHVIPEKGINDLEDWILLWNKSGSFIKDEYGDVITPEKMLSGVTDRSHPDFGFSPPDCMSWDEFHQKNHSEFGPNGLLRSRIDGVHCVKHGSGTWDCHLGEFS